MNEITNELSTDITVITAEINSYKQIVGNGIFEIGIRLKKVRDENLADSKYGNWGRWLREEVDFTDRQARRLIQVVDEFKTDDVVRIGSSKIFELIQLPSEIDRQEFVSAAHTIPSTGEVKTVDEMTVRELREVKKALKEAQERAEKAEQTVEQVKATERVLRTSLEELRQREPEIEYVNVVDEEAQRKLSEYEQRFGNLDVYDTGIMRIQSETEVVGAALSFAEDVRQFVKKYAFIETYTAELTDINGAAKRE